MQQSVDRFLGRTPDQEVLEELEAALLTADLGARVVDRLIRQINEETRGADAQTPEGLQNVLSQALYSILKPVSGSPIDQLVSDGPQTICCVSRWSQWCWKNDNDCQDGTTNETGRTSPIARCR